MIIHPPSIHVSNYQTIKYNRRYFYILYDQELVDSDFSYKCLLVNKSFSMGPGPKSSFKDKFAQIMKYECFADNDIIKHDMNNNIRLYNDASIAFFRDLFGFSYSIKSSFKDKIHNSIDDIDAGCYPTYSTGHFVHFPFPEFFSDEDQIDKTGEDSSFDEVPGMYEHKYNSEEYTNNINKHGFMGFDFYMSSLEDIINKYKSPFNVVIINVSASINNAKLFPNKNIHDNYIKILAKLGKICESTILESIVMIFTSKNGMNVHDICIDKLFSPLINKFDVQFEISQIGIQISQLYDDYIKNNDEFEYIYVKYENGILQSMIILNEKYDKFKIIQKFIFIPEFYFSIKID